MLNSSLSHDRTCFCISVNMAGIEHTFSLKLMYAQKTNTSKPVGRQVIK